LAWSALSDSVQRRTFLRNHRKAITAVDFFSGPTITFGVLMSSFSSAMLMKVSDLLWSNDDEP
jgi:hypothetical protein